MLLYLAGSKFSIFANMAQTLLLEEMSGRSLNIAESSGFFEWCCMQMCLLML
jgi:hypothetical protein